MGVGSVHLAFGWLLQWKVYDVFHPDHAWAADYVALAAAVAQLICLCAIAGIVLLTPPPLRQTFYTSLSYQRSCTTFSPLSFLLSPPPPFSFSLLSFVLFNFSSAIFSFISSRSLVLTLFVVFLPLLSLFLLGTDAWKQGDCAARIHFLSTVPPYYYRKRTGLVKKWLQDEWLFISGYAPETWRHVPPRLMPQQAEMVVELDAARRRKSTLAGFLETVAGRTRFFLLRS